MAAVALVGMAVGATVVGCGSSSSSGGDATKASSNPASKLTGEPIKIGVAVPVDAAPASYPQPEENAKAAARAINAAGGIKGRPVEIDFCNSKLDPNQEAACGRKLASDGVLATVGSMIAANPGAFMTSLKNADIADVGALFLTPDVDKFDNSFPINFPTATYIGCLTPAALKSAGGSKVAVVADDTAISRPSADVTLTAAKNLGIPVTGATYSPAQTTDFTPYVAKVSKGNPAMAVLAMSPTTQGAFASAANAAGSQMSFCARDTAMPFPTLKKLGAAAAHYYYGTSYPPPSAVDQVPGLRKYIDEMKAEQDATGNEWAGTDIDHFSPAGLQAWLSVHAVAQVADTISGKITSKSFLDAIGKAKVTFDGIMPDVDFTKSIGKGAYPRVFNDAVYTMRWNASKQDLELVSRKPLHAAQALFGAG